MSKKSNRTVHHCAQPSNNSQFRQELAARRWPVNFTRLVLIASVSSAYAQDRPEPFRSTSGSSSAAKSPIQSNESAIATGDGATASNGCPFPDPFHGCYVCETNPECPPLPPGCDDPECAQRVCECLGDDFCCTVFWDCECADAALAFCGPYPDDCTERENIFLGVTQFNTQCATTDGAQTAECGQIHNDLWFNFDPPQGCTMLRIATCGSSFDSKIAVYPSLACPAQTPLACATDGKCANGAEMIIPVNHTANYKIRVGGATATEQGPGEVNLCCNPPCEGNDTCETSFPLFDGFTTFDTASAHTEPQGPHDCCEAGSCEIARDLWYDYVAVCTGTLIVDTCNEDTFFDTKVAVYGGSCGALDVLGCNDSFLYCQNPNASFLHAGVRIDVVEGQSLKIRVGSKNGDQDQAVLRVQCGCDVDADCADVSPCNGDETCSTAGACEHGDADCASGECGCGQDAQCDDGVYCNGAETCVNRLCECGEPPCNDFPNCICNEQTDTCSCDMPCIGPIMSSSPESNTIDARQPSNLLIGCTDMPGIRVIELTFANSAANLTADEFTISLDPPGGDVPVVQEVAGVGNTALLTLEQRIPPGTWTRITYTCAGSSIRLGYLPADVNGDRTSSPIDILKLIDHLNGVEMYPVIRTDTDRSGAPNPADILRVIDLLNGADCYEVWNGRMLPN